MPAATSPPSARGRWSSLSLSACRAVLQGHGSRQPGPLPVLSPTISIFSRGSHRGTSSRMVVTPAASTASGYRMDTRSQNPLSSSSASAQAAASAASGAKSFGSRSASLCQPVPAVSLLGTALPWDRAASEGSLLNAVLFLEKAMLHAAELISSSHSTCGKRPHCSGIG